MRQRATVLLLVALLIAAWAEPASARSRRPRSSSQEAPVAPSKPAAPAVPTDAPEPPPAPLDEPEPPPAPLEEPEPAPAPLRKDQDASDALTAEEAAALQAHQTAEARKARVLRTTAGFAWTGVALTLGLAVAGTSLGILAQQRSDAQSRLTTQIADGLPPIYDAAQHSEWMRLQDEGTTYNAAAIGCLLTAGVLAVGTGLLFWGYERQSKRDLARIFPMLRADTRSVLVGLGGRF